MRIILIHKKKVLDLYLEHYKTVKKEIKEDTNK